MYADDSPVDHVKHNDAVNRLIGVNQGKGDLVTSANNTVPHALFFSHLLQADGGCTSSIGGPRLGVTQGFADHGQPLLIAAEIEAAALEKVDMFVGSRGRFRNDVLVTEEGPTANGVLSVTAVVCFLQR